MFSNIRIIVPLTMVLWIVPFQSQGFDPISAMAAVQTVEGVLDQGSQIDDAIDLAESVGELANESAVSEDLVKESDNFVKRLESINNQINESKHFSSELKDLTNFDLSRSRTLASKLKSVSRKIKQGKRIYNYLSGKKGSQSPGLQIEQIRINQRMLDELQNMRIGQFNSYLEDKENKVQLQVSLENSLKEEEAYYQKRLRSFRAKRGSL